MIKMGEGLMKILDSDPCKKISPTTFIYLFELSLHYIEKSLILYKIYNKSGYNRTL